MIRLTCWNAARSWPRLSIALLAAAFFAAGNGYAQVPPGTGQVSTPESSIEKPGDTGVRAHTNLQIFIPNRGANGAHAAPGGGGPGAAGGPLTAGARNEQRDKASPVAVA